MTAGELATVVRLRAAAGLRAVADRLAPPATATPKRRDLDLADFELGACGLEHVLLARGLDPVGVGRLIVTAPTMAQTLGEILARDLSEALDDGQVEEMRRIVDHLAGGGLL